MLYCIPGMGTDARIFSQIVPLLRWSGEICYLPYLEPLSGGEALEDYAARLYAECIAPREAARGEGAEKPILLGMSLGGMVACELSQIMPYRRLLLVSTVKNRQEQPPYFPLLRALPAHRLVPASFTKRFGPAVARWMRAFDDSFLDDYFEMMRSMSDAHLAWGRRAAVSWRGLPAGFLPENCAHLHGTRDHIFNYKRIKNADILEGGTHNMIMERADEVARWLNERLA